MKLWVLGGILALIVAGAAVGSAVVWAQAPPAAASGSGDEALALAKRVADLEAARAQERKWIETLAAELKTVKSDVAVLKDRLAAKKP
jgi:hypothetical protein